MRRTSTVAGAVDVAEDTNVDRTMGAFRGDRGVGEEARGFTGDVLVDLEAETL